MSIDTGRAIRDTAALVGIDSQNPGPQEGACGTWVQHRIAEIGLPVATHTVANGRDNLITQINGLGTAPRLIVLAHLDTVPFGSGWSQQPLGGHIVDGKLYGRGACDMKAGIALGLGLIEELAHRGQPPAGDIVFCATVDEESPHMAGAHHLVANHLIRDDDQILALEPTGCRLRIAQVGLRWLQLDIIGRQCHAGRAHLGIDANHVMARAIEAVKSVIAQLGIEDPFLGPPRVTCGTLAGGVTTNVVPGTSRATFDVRLVPPLTTASVTELIDNAVAQAVADFDGAAHVLTELGAARPPVRAAEDSRIVERLRAAHLSVTGTEIGVGGPDGHEAYTDASMIAALTGSDSCTVFGPGSSDIAHTVDEFVPLSDIELVAKVLDSMVSDW